MGVQPGDSAALPPRASVVMAPQERHADRPPTHTSPTPALPPDQHPDQHPYGPNQPRSARPHFIAASPIIVMNMSARPGAMPGAGVVHCGRCGAHPLPPGTKARIAPVPVGPGGSATATNGCLGHLAFAGDGIIVCEAGWWPALHHGRTRRSPDTAVHTGAPWFRRGCRSRNCRPRRRWPRKKRHQK